MSPWLLALLVGSVGGPIGGLIAAAAGATVLRDAGKRLRGALLAFTGGFILTVAFLELIRRGMETQQRWGLALVVGGLIIGAAVRALVTRLTGSSEQNNSDNTGGYENQQAWRIAISLAVVNLLEGLPVGAGFAVGQSVGFLIGAIMIFENFTEGLSISTELSGNNQSALKTWLMPTLPTLTLGLGAAAGAFLGGLSELILPAVLGAGAGIMLYVVADDIVYDAHRLGQGAITTVPLLLGVVVAILLVALR